MIYLRDILRILAKNQLIKVFDESKNLLFSGFVWCLDSVYMLSCPVVGLERHYNFIFIVIIYD